MSVIWTPDRRIITSSRRIFTPPSRQRGFVCMPGGLGAGRAGGGGGDPYFANVSLLLHMDGTNGSTIFTDSSGSPKTVTPSGNAQISTAQSKFGGASGRLDGSGDRLDFTASTAFALGTGDFTIEFWLYPLSFSGTYIFGWSGSVFAYCENDGRVRILSGANVTGPTTIAINTWSYIAYTRESGTSRVWVNGVSGSSSGSLGNLGTGTAGFVIGTFGPGGTSGLNMYMDEFRMTKGVCRYPGGTSFTPPTAPFPNS